MTTSTPPESAAPGSSGAALGGAALGGAAGAPRAGARVPSWLLAAATVFAIAWCGNQFTPLLVMYRLEGLAPLEVNILLGVYVLGLAPALILGGTLSDLIGRRPLLLPAPGIAIAAGVFLAAGSGSMVLLGIGRVLSGLALGLAMAVGTSWVKELSQAPHDPLASPKEGARRASLALTGGFALGAAAAASLAQFAPMRESLPYLVNVALTAVVWPALFRVPETAGARVLAARAAASGALTDADTGAVAVIPSSKGFLRALRIPSALDPRFLLLVLPMAAWIFGSSAAAYAILPVLLMPSVPGLEIGYSGLMCLVALAFGFTVQQFVRRFDLPRVPGATVFGIAATMLGMLACAWIAAELGASPDVWWLAFGAAALLGAGYGLLLVSGLELVQEIAPAAELARLTAVFYAIAYVGFFVPAILSALNAFVPYPVLFLAGAVIAAVAGAVIVLSALRFSRPRPSR